MGLSHYKQCFDVALGKLISRTAFSTIFPVVFVVLFTAVTGCETTAKDTGKVPDGNRIVARNDYDVNTGILPAKILGRHFWNMLHYSPPQSSQAKAMEKHVLKEPMVRDAVAVYSFSDLRAAGNDNLAVSGEKLLKLQPDPRLPFLICMSAGRPPFRCMDDFRVDKNIYEKWKQEHPNFLGFWTGVEWDNEYIGPLNNVKNAEEWARKHGCSDTAIKRMQDVLVRARVSKDGATAGLRECYNALRRYFFDDPEKMVFLRAGWCFDHYALEWGAGLAVMETTNTGNYRHQPSLFCVRGAARQYGKPWEWYIATYYNGYDSTGKPSVNNEPNYQTKTKSDTPGSEEHSGPGYGMSVSLSRRDKYLAYLAGASFVQHEDWPRAYCQRKDGDPKEWILSPHGESMKEWYGFIERHPDRGVSYAPVALLLPFNQGMPQWGGNPWSFFMVERPDKMIDAFMYAIAPFSQNTKKGKEGCLSNSEFGDGYDVLVPDPPSGPVPLARLLDYKVAILLGKYDIQPDLAERLMEYVRKGGTLVINSRQIGNSLPQKFLGVKLTGKTAPVEGNVSSSAGGDAITLAEPYDYEAVELCGAKSLWTDGKGGVLASVNCFGRGRVVLTTVDFMVSRQYKNFVGTTAKMPLVELLMRQIVKEVLPVEVKGDIEYGLNKVSDGWWVYLINNKGVTKYTTTPEEFDVAETASVTVNMRALRVTALRELRTGEQIVVDRNRNTFTIQVGPGDIRIVKITL
ncbi:MAG: hypothetical protein PHR77_00585 [Kiritimatiellae bacterium]|nr:hypothetical protein [Kiritimatiellia bacterium]MDD5522915.1 hypothetical protein [Kiritimatiellia bacterium]